jgi:hypothetical protein
MAPKPQEETTAPGISIKLQQIEKQRVDTVKRTHEPHERIAALIAIVSPESSPTIPFFICLFGSFSTVYQY